MSILGRERGDFVGIELMLLAYDKDLHGKMY